MGILSFIKKLFRRKPKKQIKIGLALGSGGAKGFAHLGVLKALEEEGIFVQVVSGTSIGSIVGALSAKGYSATDSYELFRRTEFWELLRHAKVRMDMSPVEELLNRYLGDADFSDLSLPFSCWATDEDSNEGVLLKEGNVAKACCASSAMPPYFSAVKIGDRYLADGAFTNAIPSESAREMGADFVIAVDLSAPQYRTEKQGGTVTSFLLQKFASAISEKELPNARTRGYESADIVLAPDLHAYRPTMLSRSLWDEMFEAGYAEGKARAAEIKEKIKNFTTNI